MIIVNPQRAYRFVISVSRMKLHIQYTNLKETILRFFLKMRDEYMHLLCQEHTHTYDETRISVYETEGNDASLLL